MLSWYHSSAITIWNSVYWRRQLYTINWCAGYVGHLYRVNGDTKAWEVFWQMLTWAIFLFCFFRTVTMLFLILYLFIVYMFILVLVVLGLHCWLMCPALAGRFLSTLPPAESLSWALKGKGGEVKERVEWAESVKAGKCEIASFRDPSQSYMVTSVFEMGPSFCQSSPICKNRCQDHCQEAFSLCFPSGILWYPILGLSL